MERKRVVSAVIVRTEHGGQCKVLLTMRDGRAAFANHWECPGGRVEPGETDEQALRREIEEELGISSIRIGEPIGTVDIDPPVVPMPITITFYHVKISPEGHPEARTARCLAWFEAEALDELPFTPANRLFCKDVKELL